MEKLLFLIPLLPLAGAALSGAIHAGLAPRKSAGVVANLAVWGAFALALSLFLGLDPGGVMIARGFTWIQAGSFRAAFDLRLDSLSAVMILVVTGVSALIHLYSVGYMAHDEGFAKFFAYLNLFVFAMSLLVLGANMLLMFVGWEGVGLMSYLLIGFWYDREEGFAPEATPARAGQKAFIVNRIGDFGFLLGIFLLATHFGSLDYGVLKAKAASGALTPGLALAVGLLLFMGATGKSAQIPLYIWLPDAMAGPTPVSALIHAATMVTAGVYMVSRCSFIYVHAPIALGVVALVGGLTAALAAAIAVTQRDIKKVLAYSTVSQLGYMFLGCGAGAFSAAVFHLTTHAFFKALLFLGAGSVMHAMHEELDIVKMGGLKKYMPITYLTFLAGAFSLAGMPPFSGFFSKDEILWQTVRFGDPFHVALYALGALTAVFTAFYTFRMVSLTFLGKERFDPEQVHPHESPPTMTIPLVVLAILATVGGFLGLPHVFGHLNLIGPFVERSTAALEESGGLGHGAEWIFLLVGVGCALLGILPGWALYKAGPGWGERMARRLRPLHLLSYGKFFVDEIYAFLVVAPLRLFSLACALFDLAVVDGLVNGTARRCDEAGGAVNKVQDGKVSTYAAWFAAGALVLGIIVLVGVLR